MELVLGVLEEGSCQEDHRTVGWGPQGGLGALRTSLGLGAPQDKEDELPSSLL